MAEPEHQHMAIREALQADDDRALELIWAAYGRLLFTLIAGIVGARHDAEEVQQEPFLQIARKRRQLLRAGNLRAYLCAMARHAALSWLRSPQRREAATDPRDFWLVPSDETGDLEPDTVAVIARALAELPEEQRTVVVLKLYENLTLQEIGEVLGVSPNTAASRYRYALERLRPKLLEARPP